MQKTVGLGLRVIRAIGNYCRSTYIPFWIVTIIASIYSCMLVYSATNAFGTRTLYVQIIACVVGYIGAIIISLMDYERLGEIWYVVAGICLFLVGLTFIWGESASGAFSTADDKAWLNIFGISFQPSELMKIGFLVTFSYHLSHTIKDGNLNSLPHLLLLLGHIGVPVLLIMEQGDHGTALMFMVMAVIIIFGCGIDWKYILFAALAVLAALPIIWNILPPFQRERIRAVYNPREGDEMNILYQQTMGRLAIGSGGLTGQGWLKGQMTQGELVPSDHNDFIFAVAAEEFGFIGATAVIVIEILIMVFTLYTALNARDNMGRFICLGFFGLIAAQTVFNLGMCLVVLPVIGITLPFFSAGGSSSMCLYFGFGLVLSVYMRKNESNMRFANAR